MPSLKKTVMGVDAPPPKLTLGALGMFMKYVGLPVLVVFFGIDVLIWILTSG